MIRSRRVAGVDEAGRGPLAGPVFAAAVILDPGRRISGLADSKILEPERREELADKIRSRALAWGIGRAEVEEIDTINILQATLLAMQRAVAALMLPPEMVLVDGDRAPIVACHVRTVIKGDASVPAISAASILAKVTRDAEMCALEDRYPGYGFAKHKGYGTEEHLRALDQLGVCAVHRRSFAPIRLRIVI